MPKLFVISAPSGGGKTTLCQRLLADFPNLTLSISTTTRAPRGEEQEGVEYFFVSQAQFKKMIKDKAFAEWAEVHGNFYGTSRAVIDEAFSQGKSVLLDIDVQGADSLKQSYGERCFRIFIAPPSLQELEFRLRARGTDSEESVQRRLRNAQIELEKSAEFERTVVNDALERAYAELKAIVAAELAKDSVNG